MRILIRADADETAGIGHVMRMFALADCMKDNEAEVWLASARLHETLEAQALTRGITVVRESLEPGSAADARWTVTLAAKLNVDWVAADGYTFDAGFQQSLGAAGIPLLFVDDCGHCTHYSAELVLNQNLHAQAALYANRADHTRLLLGTAFALLRREFLAASTAGSPVPRRADRILVTMGGADSTNATETIIQALAKLRNPAMKARVVVGPGSPNFDRLCESVADSRVELLKGADNMAALMRWAELAIAAAGTTTYELCFLGVPTMLVVVADNQVALADAMSRARACQNLGWHHELDVDAAAARIHRLCSAPTARRSMIDRGRQAVDGRGSSRVLEAMRRYS